MKGIILLISILFLQACASTNSTRRADRAQASVKEKLQLEVIKLEMIPGNIKHVKIPLNQELEKVELVCEGKKVITKTIANEVEAFIAIPYAHEKKVFTCSISTPEHLETLVVHVNVKPANYKTSYIKVPKRKVDMNEEDIAWWKNDLKVLEDVYANLDKNEVYFDKPFVKPLKSKITSIYGSKRIFNDKKMSWHSGIDFRARPGTRIPSTNRGKVILTHHLFFNGKTVLVDHGMGIISMYCHLSDYTVSVGDIVDQGDIVGLSGNTGRSSAPHLHWGIKMQDSWMNGFSLIEESRNFLIQ